MCCLWCRVSCESQPCVLILSLPSVTFSVVWSTWTVVEEEGGVLLHGDLWRSLSDQGHRGPSGSGVGLEIVEDGPRDPPSFQYLGRPRGLLPFLDNSTVGVTTPKTVGYFWLLWDWDWTSVLDGWRGNDLVEEDVGVVKRRRVLCGSWHEGWSRLTCVVPRPSSTSVLWVTNGELVRCHVRRPSGYRPEKDVVGVPLPHHSPSTRPGREKKCPESSGRTTGVSRSRRISQMLIHPSTVVRDHGG